MRSEGNPLDLNNLPEDYCRDKPAIEETGYRKKKNGAKDGKDESGKIYECRFCSLKFCKSQALGGHMNRHRQERETETLNRARHLVLTNDNIAPPHLPPHLGCCHPVGPRSYHSANDIGDPAGMPFRFPAARMFSGSSSSTLLPPQSHQPPPFHPPYLYTSSSRPTSFSTNYQPQQPINEYFVGHIFGSASGPMESSSYTCVGAPVGHGFGGGGGGRDGSGQSNQEEGLNWVRGYAGSQQPRLDVPSFNRFQDGL